MEEKFNPRVCAIMIEVYCDRDVTMTQLTREYKDFLTAEEIDYLREWAGCYKND